MPMISLPPKSTIAAEPPMAARPLLVLSLSALGIVFGDIGTSPLYAYQVAIQAAAGAIRRVASLPVSESSFSLVGPD